jgi:hypothetical protein
VAVLRPKWVSSAVKHPFDGLFRQPGSLALVREQCRLGCYNIWELAFKGRCDPGV